MADNIERLKPDIRNANKGTVRGRALLEDSLRRHGAGRSILADKHGNVIAGNKTLESAADIGLPVRFVQTDGTELVVVQRTDLDLDSDSGRSLAYLDNRVAELDLSWDVAELLADRDAGLDLAAVGFGADELAELMAGLDIPTGGLTDPDAVPGVPAEPVTRPGDLIVMGNHRLLCGDNTIVTNYDRLMGDDRARICVTSPPYNQEIDSFRPSGMQRENPAFVNRMASSYADTNPEDQYQREQVELLEMLATYLTRDGSIFYNHKIRYRGKRIISPLEWLLRLSFPVRQEIIWDRGSSITLNARMFIPADERIYWLRVGDDFLFNDTAEIKAYSTVWEIGAVNDVQVTAAFAREIPLRCIAAASLPGDIVLEPHAGSGTTLIAAEQLGRTCYGMEISPAYVDVCVRRWEGFTGKTAVRA
jgi:DNA modification methylase